MVHRSASASLVLALLACGPGGLGSADVSETGSSEGSSGSESSDSTAPDPDESETDESEPDPTTSSFIPEQPCDPDLGFWCTPACEVFYQDCPEGEKCTPYASAGGTWDAKKCVPVLGDLGPGEPCSYEGRESATDDCDATGMCYDGICRSFCTGIPEDPSCAPGFGCAAAANDVLAICLERCDPLVQDCTIGACYWNHDEFLCNPSGDIEVGQACGLVDDCSPGAACLDGEALPGCEGSRCCAPLCNLDQPDCASLPGTECVAWYEPGEAPTGLELLGVCVSP